MFIHLSEDIPHNSRICIYGTGKRGLILKKYLAKHREDIDIKCFIDSYRNNGTIDGLEVVNINSFSNIQYDFIILASGFWQEIREDLKRRDILNYKILGFHFATCMESEIVPAESIKTFEEGKLPEYESYFKDVIKLLDNAGDKKIYEKIYDVRAGKIGLNALYQEFQNTDRIFYQYLDYINKDEIKTIIDCGAYDTSGIDLLLRHLNKIKAVYGFEPLCDIYCPEIEDIFPEKSCEINIIPKATFSH